MACLGCALANGGEAAHMVYENEHVACFLDHDPFDEGHTLIVPKRHVVELEALDEAQAAAVMAAARQVSLAIKRLYHPDGITVCQNGGVFNELGHFHLHVVPRRADRPFAAFYSEEAAAPRAHGLEVTARALRDAIGKHEALERARPPDQA
ncbi:HIT family protein [Chromobacterium vaccinii]|uniref:HIT family protein n=1 Tax=Chromobacterium vaccinii TaxID=1108595 RepID=UPI003C763FA5